MFVTVIDEHLEQVDVILHEVPVVVPTRNVQLAFERVLWVFNDEGLILYHLLSNVADLKIKQLREDNSDRALRSIIGYRWVVNKNTS